MTSHSEKRELLRDYLGCHDFWHFALAYGALTLGMGSRVDLTTMQCLSAKLGTSDVCVVSCDEVSMHVVISTKHISPAIMRELNDIINSPST